MALYGSHACSMTLECLAHLDVTLLLDTHPVKRKNVAVCVVQTNEKTQTLKYHSRGKELETVSRSGT